LSPSCPYLVSILLLVSLAACSTRSSEMNPTQTFTDARDDSYSATPNPGYTKTPEAVLQPTQLITQTKPVTQIRPTPAATSWSPTSTPSRTPVPPVAATSTLKPETQTDTPTQVQSIQSRRENEIDSFTLTSLDGRWTATSCGYKRDQMMLVENSDGMLWILEFADFLNPDTPADIMGRFDPLRWSENGKYLYFSKSLGYDGGGDQCFQGYGYYGLYRLNLVTGKWVAIIPTQDLFPGDKMEFSHDGRYVAADTRGIAILNLETLKTTKITASGLMDFEWSPDSTYLAYSTAHCSEFFAESSSVYIWDVKNKRQRKILEVENMVLRPEYWVENSILHIEGDRIVGHNVEYTIFEFDLRKKEVIFTGTATPRP
jgi:hypothetical protein